MLSTTAAEDFIHPKGYVRSSSRDDGFLYRFLAKVWGKTGSKLYGSRSGSDYIDNHKRFTLFCKAAIESTRALPFGPGEDCVFVANDWHSALVPLLLKVGPAQLFRTGGGYPVALQLYVLWDILIAKVAVSTGVMCADRANLQPAFRNCCRRALPSAVVPSGRVPALRSV